MNEYTEWVRASIEGDEMFLIHLKLAQEKCNVVFQSCGSYPGLSLHESVTSLLPTSNISLDEVL